VMCVTVLLLFFANARRNSLVWALKLLFASASTVPSLSNQSTIAHARKIPVEV
jgi:hypothetical protein